MPKIQGTLTVKSIEDKEVIPIKGIMTDSVWTLYDNQSIKYRFEYRDNVLKYDKISEEHLRFMFDVYRDTEASYEIHHRKIGFLVKTKSVVVDKHDVFVKYDLFQGDDLLNSVEFALVCKDIEE